MYRYTDRKRISGTCGKGERYVQLSGIKKRETEFERIYAEWPHTLCFMRELPF